MPYAIFDYMGPFLRSGFAHVDNVIPVIKTITWLLLSSCKATNHTGTLLGTLPPEPRPTCAGTLQNPSRTFCNLPEPTLRNLPETASGTYTSTRRNSPEPSWTFRNLPPEPAPATRTGTHRSLSGLKTPLAYAVGEKLWVCDGLSWNLALKKARNHKLSV